MATGFTIVEGEITFKFPPEMTDPRYGSPIPIRDILMIGRLADAIEETQGRWDVKMRDALSRLLPIFKWAEDSRAEKIENAISEWDKATADFQAIALKADLPDDVRRAGDSLAMAVISDQSDMVAMFENYFRVIHALLQYHDALDPKHRLQGNGGTNEEAATTLRTALTTFLADHERAEEITSHGLNLWTKMYDPTQWAQAVLAAKVPSTDFTLPAYVMPADAQALYRVAAEVYENSVANGPADVVAFQTPGKIQDGDMKFETPGIISVALTDFFTQYCRFRHDAKLSGEPEIAPLEWYSFEQSMWDAHSRYKTKIPEVRRRKLPENDPFSTLKVYSFTRLSCQITDFAELAFAMLDDKMWADIASHEAQSGREQAVVDGIARCRTVFELGC